MTNLSNWRLDQENSSEEQKDRLAAQAEDVEQRIDEAEAALSRLAVKLS